MRAPCALSAILAVLALGACGGDDGGGEQQGDKPAPTTTTQAAPATPPPAEGEKPPFPPTLVFSGDEVLKCVDGKGLAATREEKPPAGDEVGRGIVHDRVLVGGEAGKPALRLFMFGSQDLAKEQGALVKERTPEARILGTAILEPLEGAATGESETAIACLEEQAG